MGYKKITVGPIILGGRAPVAPPPWIRNWKRYVTIPIFENLRPIKFQCDSGVNQNLVWTYHIGL